MGLTEKAKEFADRLFGKLELFGERAATKVAEFSGVAREKTPGYLDRAADMAGRAVESTAARVDKATGGKYHDKIEGASTKLSHTLDRTPGTAAPGSATPSAPPASAAGGPVPPATTTPDTTKPDEPGTTRPGGPGPGTIPGPTR
ncbi:antitoxin [Pseudonocardia alaniniphila]|uniref:Antitoxin n=1 Tax=Pseudonocardia alaniniphila TaxID=75291 RepID=A0ABS9TTH1_9PSEU|nr:antitoxin [Pseudonocardia alaniniphila]MCH6171829.1 antitoxin [Pseudonocardia alaniniphila]